MHGEHDDDDAGAPPDEGERAARLRAAIDEVLAAHARALRALADAVAPERRP